MRGAAYRIRTYDALIRSQVLYPAEVTPRAVSYIASLARDCQARFENNLSGTKIKKPRRVRGLHLLAESWGFEPQIPLGGILA